MTPAYKKMRRRLEDSVELYKLHVKHYHMSPTQFRRRTSKRGLPESVYRKYEDVCHKRRVCNTSIAPPPRARVSGILASNFGDVIFVDHAEILLRKNKYMALLVLDGAANLLWATAKSSLSNKETVQALRLCIHFGTPRSHCSSSSMGFSLELPTALGWLPAPPQDSSLRGELRPWLDVIHHTRFHVDASLVINFIGNPLAFGALAIVQSGSAKCSKAPNDWSAQRNQSQVSPLPCLFSHLLQEQSPGLSILVDFGVPDSPLHGWCPSGKRRRKRTQGCWPLAVGLDMLEEASIATLISFSK